MKSENIWRNSVLINRYSAYWNFKQNKIIIFFWHISSRYAKILGETHFRTLEIPQKQKTERKRRERKERLNDGNNDGQAMHGARKHAWRTQAAWANLKRHPSFTLL